MNFAVVISFFLLVCAFDRTFGSLINHLQIEDLGSCASNILYASKNDVLSLDIGAMLNNRPFSNEILRTRIFLTGPSQSHVNFKNGNTILFVTSIPNVAAGTKCWFCRQSDGCGSNPSKYLASADCSNTGGYHFAQEYHHIIDNRKISYLTILNNLIIIH